MLGVTPAMSRAGISIYGLNGLINQLAAKIIFLYSLRFFKDLAFIVQSNSNSTFLVLTVV